MCDTRFKSFKFFKKIDEIETISNLNLKFLLHIRNI